MTEADVKNAIKKWRKANVMHYNEVRLHSAIGYVTPHTKLAGNEKAVFADRDAKLETAREQRRIRRAAARQSVA